MRLFFAAIIFALSIQAQSVQHKRYDKVSPSRKQIDAELAEITKSKKIPTVWLTPERAKALSLVTSRSYITKMERKGDVIVYHWTNGLHGAVTTQRIDNLVNRPAKDARREQLEKIKSDAEKFRKERDDLKTENANLKKGQQKK